MRVLGGIAVAALLGACTSVKMVQRDGCWVKRTERIFWRVQEQVGPCARPQPQWAQDRLTRVVQECVAQADYRWQGRAIEAFSKGLPFSAQPPPQETARACMEEARTGLAAENERLKERLGEMKEQFGEVATERDALRSESRKDRDQLRASLDKMADHLGEAAKKPAGAAHATATSSSDGRATNESGATLATESGSTSAGAPFTNAVTVPERPRQPAASPPSKKVAARARPARDPTRAAKAPACEPAPACPLPLGPALTCPVPIEPPPVCAVPPTADVGIPASALP